MGWPRIDVVPCFHNVISCLFGRSSADGFWTGEFSTGDFFLFLIVDGAVIVCGNKPWGVVDSIIEVDNPGEGFVGSGWSTRVNQ